MQDDAVGDIVVSDPPEFTAGDIVIGRLHWADYSLAKGSALNHVDPSLGQNNTTLAF